MDRTRYLLIVALAVWPGVYGCDDNLTEISSMVLVSAGSYWMGCNEAVDDHCGINEKPYHEVSLDAYYIDKTEVTMKEFLACVDVGVCSHHLDDQTCYYIIFENGDLAQGGIWNAYRGDNQPMVCVDWAQAKQFCEWAGKRLPTEAEWEKAARGTDGRKYPWGNQEPDCDRAVMYVGDGSECAPQVTADVCSKSPVGDSPYGLCDMAGNVREWVADWFAAEYFSASPTENPKGPNTGTYRVSRGGGFDLGNDVRVSGRLGAKPSEAIIYRGFRCVRSVETVQAL
jgi:formylglycine-generating enzyme required for sulfatase activity